MLGVVVNVTITFVIVFFLGGKAFTLAAQILSLGLSGYVVGRRFSFSKIGMVSALIASSLILFMLLFGGFSAAAFILFAELVSVGAFSAFAGIGLGGRKLAALNKKLQPTADAAAE